jgi:hypothetical protein
MAELNSKLRPVIHYLGRFECTGQVAVMEKCEYQRRVKISGEWDTP